MIRKTLLILCLVPLAAIIVATAVANRHDVTIVFDPWLSMEPPLTVQLPLFILAFGLVTLGVILGGVATWIGQRRWRRAARRGDIEASRLRHDLESLRRLTERRGALPPPTVRSIRSPAA